MEIAGKLTKLVPSLEFLSTGSGKLLGAEMRKYLLHKTNGKRLPITALSGTDARRPPTFTANNEELTKNRTTV